MNGCETSVKVYRVAKEMIEGDGRESGNRTVDEVGFKCFPDIFVTTSTHSNPNEGGCDGAWDSPRAAGELNFGDQAVSSDEVRVTRRQERIRRALGRTSIEEPRGGGWGHFSAVRTCVVSGDSLMQSEVLPEGKMGRIGVEGASGSESSRD